MLWQSFHFSKSNKRGFFSHTLALTWAKFLLEKFFEKISPSCCRIYTKHFTFVSRKQLSRRIIWFYLVRAEVVLWWHCLIFFAADRAKLFKNGNSKTGTARSRKTARTGCTCFCDGVSVLFHYQLSAPNQFSLLLNMEQVNPCRPVAFSQIEDCAGGFHVTKHNSL